MTDKMHLVFQTSGACYSKYCGRLANSTSCAACPWGSRVLISKSGYSSHICQPCDSFLTLYDWLFIGFTFMLPVLYFHLILSIETYKFDSIESGRKFLLTKKLVLVTSDVSNFCQVRTFYCKIWVLSFICLSIHITASIFTLLVYPPVGSALVYKCSVGALEDFYAPLFSAYGCLYETAFPFVSLPIAYYSLSAVLSVIFCPLLFICLFSDYSLLKFLYYTLYAYPCFCILNLVFCGLFYFYFSYILLGASILDSLYRFPIIFDYYMEKQSKTNNYLVTVLYPICHPLDLLKQIYSNPTKYIFPFLFYSVCIGYSLIAHFEMVDWYLVSTILPLLFYLLMLPLTHPFLHKDYDYMLNKLSENCDNLSEHSSKNLRQFQTNQEPQTNSTFLSSFRTLRNLNE